MGKNKDKMAMPAADKTPKGMKVDKARTERLLSMKK